MLNKIKTFFNRDSLNNLKNPKEYLRNLLCEEDFAKLEKLNNDTNWAVDWETLASPWVCEINSDGKLDWVIWPSNLILVNCPNLTSLEPIIEFKETLSINFCGKLLNLDPVQNVWKSLQIHECKNLTSLGTTKKTLHSANLENASSSLQKEAFLKNKKDPEFISWELSINPNLEKFLRYLSDNWELDFERFTGKYWKYIWEIEGEEWKKEAKSILVYFYKEKLKETNEKIESLVKEAEIKKEEVQRLHDEFVEFKTKIENFWIKLEELKN